MCEVLLGEMSSEEIMEVTKNNQHEVADVCHDQDVVQGFSYLVFGDRFGGIASGYIVVTLVGTVAKHQHTLKLLETNPLDWHSGRTPVSSRRGRTQPLVRVTQHSVDNADTQGSGWASHLLDDSIRGTHDLPLWVPQAHHQGRRCRYDLVCLRSGDHVILTICCTHDPCPGFSKRTSQIMCTSMQIALDYSSVQS